MAINFNTTLKRPAPPDSRRFLSRCLKELIDYGGQPITRAEAILDMQASGLDQRCVDRWLQGYELAQRIRRRTAAIHVSVEIR